MLHALIPPVTQHVRHMFAPLSFQASCAAVLAGTCPGRVLVDDLETPSAGCVLTPEVLCVAGDASNDRFCSDLGEWLRDPEALGMPAWHVVMVFASPRWAVQLGRIAGEYPVARLARRHYLCNDPEGLPDLPMPAGTVLRRIDDEFLHDENLTRPRHLEGWVRGNWRSTADFLVSGFGVAALCANEVVGWSIADCVVDDACEIGIHTAGDWRRRGLGAFTANGAIRLAFSLGMGSVGWHCHETNVASSRTAEKAGFTLEREYTEYGVCQPRSAGDVAPGT
jgi:RimJ/RimL family protein N-acetyltransferase